MTRSKDNLCEQMSHMRPRDSFGFLRRSVIFIYVLWSATLVLCYVNEKVPPFLFVDNGYLNLFCWF